MTTPPPDDRRKRPLRVALALLVLPVLACYQGIAAPACDTLADCPSGKGYTTCEDGHCFVSGRCDGSMPVAGDGCCAVIEGDRTPDTDCLVADHDLGCREPAGPVADSKGDLFVTCRSVDSLGVSNVVLSRIDPAGAILPPVILGLASAILPPMVSRGTDVYAAFAGGVVRFDAATGIRSPTLGSVAPVGGLVSTGSSDAFHSVVGWPTVAGTVVLYDEDVGTTQVFTAGPISAGTTGAFPPTVSASGHRIYLLWEDGKLWSVETAISPTGARSSFILPARPVASPVEVDGRIFIAMEGGVLVALAERQPTFEKVWEMSLGGEVAGGLLVDPTGAVTAVLASGDVVVVRDLVDRGSLVGRGSFGAAMGDLYPFLGAAPRVVAMTADGRGVASLLRTTDDGGGVTFTSGLSFGVPVAIVGTPLLFGKRMWMATESGRLVAWQFPDVLPYGRFARGGSDVGGTGRTTVAVPQQ